MLSQCAHQRLVITIRMRENHFKERLKRVPVTIKRLQVAHAAGAYFDTLEISFFYFAFEDGVWVAVYTNKLSNMASLSKRERAEFKKVFDVIDADKSGKISKSELRKLLIMLNKSDISEDETELMFAAADKDGNGAIDFDEFLASFEQGVSHPSKDDLEVAFKMMDQNGDGFLSRDEIKAGLIKAGQPMSEEAIDDMLTAADSDMDKKISYQEFVKMLKS